MSIRWKNGRPLVEVYDPTVGKKVHVRPRDHDMDLRDLTGRALERAAKTLEAKALEAVTTRRPGVGQETCASFATRWPDDFPRGEATNLHARERLSAFIAEFQDTPLRGVTRDQARDFARQHPHRIATVKTMWADAIEEGLADENPFAKLGPAKTAGREGIVVLTRDELDQLCDTALAMHPGPFGYEVRAMILWAAGTCVRPGETMAARYSRLTGDIYDLRTQWHSKLRKETAPKHGSVGEIYVPDFARQAVIDKPRRLDDDLMFRTGRGKQFRQESLHRAWNPVRNAFTAGLPGTHDLARRLAANPDDRLAFHELRHFGASYMLNVLELEPWVIAQQLRHSDDGTLVLRLYGHPERRRALDRIRRAYTAASGENVRRLDQPSGESRGTTTAQGA